MYCKNCGTNLSSEMNHCFKCGTAIEQQATNQFNSVQSQQVSQSQSQVTNKSKIAAGLLGIFLGGLGIHNFYLGKTGIGIAQIIVTFVTCGFGSLWGFIEGILILVGSIDKDADGNLLV